MSPADDFPGGTPVCEPVTASSNDGNVPANVLDNNLNTRWSANGDGQWIQFCLNNSASVTGVDIAFYQGNTRIARFDVLVSADGNTWTTAASNLQSSGTSTALQAFSFTPKTGKYVRIVGHGNSVNLWNSYTEVKVRTAVPIAASTTPAPDAKTSAQPLEINAYPNPFRGTISVNFRLKEASFTTLGIYDMSGKLVSRQISERLQAGSHNRTLEAGNLPVGTYLLKVVHNGKVSTKKLSKQ